MEQNIQVILDDYHKADSYRRLNLYLQYPELRSAFMVIDQAGDEALVFDIGNNQQGEKNGWKSLLTAVATIFWKL